MTSVVPYLNQKLVKTPSHIQPLQDLLTTSGLRTYALPLGDSALLFSPDFQRVLYGSDWAQKATDQEYSDAFDAWYEIHVTLATPEAFASNPSVFPVYQALGKYVNRLLEIGYSKTDIYLHFRQLSRGGRSVFVDGDTGSVTVGRLIPDGRKIDHYSEIVDFLETVEGYDLSKRDLDNDFYNLGQSYPRGTQPLSVDVSSATNGDVGDSLGMPYLLGAFGLVRRDKRAIVWPNNFLTNADSFADNGRGWRRDRYRSFLEFYADIPYIDVHSFGGPRAQETVTGSFKLSYFAENKPENGANAAVYHANFQCQWTIHLKQPTSPEELALGYAYVFDYFEFDSWVSRDNGTVLIDRNEQIQRIIPRWQNDTGYQNVFVSLIDTTSNWEDTDSVHKIERARTVTTPDWRAPGYSTEFVKPGQMYPFKDDDGYSDIDSLNVMIARGYNIQWVGCEYALNWRCDSVTVFDTAGQEYRSQARSSRLAPLYRDLATKLAVAGNADGARRLRGAAAMMESTESLYLAWNSPGGVNVPSDSLVRLADQYGVTPTKLRSEVLIEKDADTPNAVSTTFGKAEANLQKLASAGKLASVVGAVPLGNATAGTGVAVQLTRSATNPDGSYPEIGDNPTWPFVVDLVVINGDETDIAELMAEGRGSAIGLWDETNDVISYITYVTDRRFTSVLDALAWWFFGVTYAEMTRNQAVVPSSTNVLWNVDGRPEKVSSWTDIQWLIWAGGKMQQAAPMVGSFLSRPTGVGDLTVADGKVEYNAADMPVDNVDSYVANA